MEIAGGRLLEESGSNNSSTSANNAAVRKVLGLLMVVLVVVGVAGSAMFVGGEGGDLMLGEGGLQGSRVEKEHVPDAEDDEAHHHHHHHHHHNDQDHDHGLHNSSEGNNNHSSHGQSETETKLALVHECVVREAANVTLHFLDDGEAATGGGLAQLPIWPVPMSVDSAEPRVNAHGENVGVPRFLAERLAVHVQSTSAMQLRAALQPLVGSLCDGDSGGDDSRGATGWMIRPPTGGPLWDAVAVAAAAAASSSSSSSSSTSFSMEGGAVREVVFRLAAATTDSSPKRSSRRQPQPTFTSEDTVKDDAYTLVIDAPSAVIEASSIRGLMHGWTSFVQLWSPVTSSNSANAAPSANVFQSAAFPITVRDSPQSPWRGLLMDVVRHYFPPRSLKRVIDGMAMAKMNVMHLHLFDSQAFPVLLNDDSSGDPNLRLSTLADRGAFDETKVYSIDVLRRLHDYARDRGVQIVPEIDLPAHTRAWGLAFPEILVNCSEAASLRPHPSDVPVLDPSNEHTYRILNAVFTQIFDTAFRNTSVVHLGGDEMRSECWESDERLMAWAHGRGLNNATALWQYFLERVLQLPALRRFNVYRGHAATDGDGTDSANRGSSGGKIILWQDTPGNGIRLTAQEGIDPSHIVIEPWRCWSHLHEQSAKLAVEQHHNLLSGACWYLDWNMHWDSLLRSKPPREILFPGSHYDALHNRTTPYTEAHVLGGEVALWTERVDPSTLDCRLWPRTAAVASVLWRGDRSPSVPSAVSRGRLGHFHSMLHARGYRVSPVATQLGNDDQCPPLAQATQRPVRSDRLVLAQLNADDGGNGNEDRIRALETFLAEQSAQGALAVGLCELNGWHLRPLGGGSSTGADRRSVIETRAAEAGFGFSHILHSTAHPYNIGVVASFPFDVRTEMGTPTFERGLLHVYFREFDLHVIVVHLHAHSAQARRQEARVVRELVESLGTEARVAVMGDMNTLSPYDHVVHAEEKLHEFLLRGQGSMFSHLRQKYLNTRGHLAYEPMEELMGLATVGRQQENRSAASGEPKRPQQVLYDACWEACKAFVGDLTEPVQQAFAGVGDDDIADFTAWSLEPTEAEDHISSCMSERCAYTEPTELKPDYPELPAHVWIPRIRLDFVLVNQAVLLGSGSDLAAHVLQSPLTGTMSDHYPMRVSWPQTVQWRTRHRHVRRRLRRRRSLRNAMHH